MNNSNKVHTTGKQSIKPLLKPRKPVYVYHWGRIFTGMIALLATAGVVYGLLSWFAPSSQEGLDTAEIPAKAKAEMEDQRPGAESETVQSEIEDRTGPIGITEQETLPAEVAETTDVSTDSESETTLPEETAPAVEHRALLSEHSSLETPSLTSEVAQATGANPTAGDIAGEEAANAMDSGESEADAQSSEELLALGSEDEFAEPQAEISQNMPLDNPGESPTGVEKAPSAGMTNSHFQLEELNIVKPFVKRFLLTRSVSNREPQGELTDISFNADGSAAVWAYSEMVDKLGSLFKYVWLHDGNQVATVPVKVRGNRWRSYSSKIINQTMRGSWRVELQDSEGNLMASADFFLE